MKRRVRRAAIASGIASLIVAVITVPGFPWSKTCRHLIRKLTERTDMTVWAWRGSPPRLISLRGRVVVAKRPLRGADVEALDSASGWAGLTDAEGRFLLRDVKWYPGARYSLLITASEYQTREVNIMSPLDYPVGGVVDAGEVNFNRACRVVDSDLPGKNSRSRLDYDRANLVYYKQLFDRLTDGAHSDEERLDAVSRYVSGKLYNAVPQAAGRVSYCDSRPPEDVLEYGSAYCGELALALATVAEAGHYRTRLIDLIDPHSQAAHMVAEVYYGDRWHLYDPIGGVVARAKGGGPASYREVRLSECQMVKRTIPEHLPRIQPHPEPTGEAEQMEALYRSGSHHYYSFAR